MIKSTFGCAKPIIAMVHFPPLPGTPLYDAKGGMQKIIDSAAVSKVTTAPASMSGKARRAERHWKV